MAEHIGKITSAATKKKYKGEGTTFAVIVEGDTKFTYYINREQDAHLRDIASKLVDTVVVVNYEVSGDFRNITSIEPATEQEVAAKSEAYEIKDMHIIREACIKAAARITVALINDNWEAEDAAKETVKVATIFEAYVYGQPKKSSGPEPPDAEFIDKSDLPPDDHQVSESSNRATEAQVKAIHALRPKLQISDKIYHDDIKARFDADSTEDLTKNQASTIIAELQKARGA